MPLTWRRSSRCEANNCVEVAVAGDMVMIRDSWSPTGPFLRFSREDFAAFAAGLARGDLQLE
ncbi:DUF397 domain-containing protein [Dactylosporangium sp. AC04546]|uniref:DUF397 domain-containing protein n=1 Tax=Dactylosporangium sp. AC04546 TaxID=2862460 RepID=UPI001EDCE119|nr:DUF397 domain-containing protein [Dactylosporangium sp. AC04546]WVK89749.1 DUF397 domain-containing protein [Dactylosporangium sp. AC04546]